MEKMKQDFVRSGYKLADLTSIEGRAREKLVEERNQEEKDILTFLIFFFNDIKSFEKIMKDAEADIHTLIGDTKIMMAVKKNPSIGNNMVRNKVLSNETHPLENQKCGGPGCLQCPLVNTNGTATVNNMRLRSAQNLNCKSRNVIYLWQCQICRNENSYFGRTIQKSHKQTNTHR